MYPVEVPLELFWIMAMCKCSVVFPLQFIITQYGNTDHKSLRFSAKYQPKTSLTFRLRQFGNIGWTKPSPKNVFNML